MDAERFMSPFKSRFPQSVQGERITFHCPPGVPVRAMANGIIIRASWDDPNNPAMGLGLRIRQLVSLPGFDSWTLVYGHIKELRTHIGKTVRMGETLGLSGDKLTIYLMDRYNEIRPIPFESD